MILVDTSVIIDYLKTGDPLLLATFQSHDAAICGVTRAEVLHGARNALHISKLTAALNSFRQVPIPESLWDLAGTNLARLRSGGIVVPFADVIIATLANELKEELWTRDKQFLLIQKVLPTLRLFPEP